MTNNPTPYTIHVSPGGRDGGDGTEANPVASLERARELARERTPGTPVTIALRPGLYMRRDSFVLDERDSGTSEAPLTLAAGAPGTVRLCGGTPVAAARWRPVSDPAVRQRLPAAVRDHVRELDLQVAGIRHTGPFPDLFRDRGGIPELIYRGRRMAPARWPNEGYATIETVTDSGVWSGKDTRGGTFVYRENRPSAWTGAVADGLWLKGFWRVPWQPECVRIEGINPENRTITHASHVGGGLGSKYSKEVDGTRPGNGKEAWYAFNLIEELDLPGEWCIRFPAKMLYFLPPQELKDGDVVLSDTDAPLISLEGASHVRITGLILETALGTGITVTGGTANRVAGCEFRNLGGTAVIVRGGTNHAVRSCTMHDLGEGGVYVGGGDRKTLTPAGHEVVNNHMYRLGQVVTTYAPAVKLGAYGFDAVGCRVANNRIHDLPHAAVLYGGNDNILERNEVYRVALDSGDVGAFYTWHDWTSRGNVLRHNLVYDSPRANAFYLDDGDSGDTIEGNIIWRTAYGPFIGGGHDNVIRGNIVLACPRGIHVDDRGVSRGYTAANRQLTERLASVDVRTPPWSERYPELARLLDEHPDWPTGTVIEDNALVGCPTPLHIAAKPERLADARIRDNAILDANAAGLGETVPESLTTADLARLAARLGKAIPVTEIGLRQDEFRQTIPPRDIPDAGTPATGEVFDSEVDMRESNRRGGG